MLYPIGATDPFPPAFRPTGYLSQRAIASPFRARTGLQPLRALDLGLTMKRMRPTARTELLDREFLGLTLLVLGGRVIAPLASVACQPYQVSHLKPSSQVFGGLRCHEWRLKSKAHDGNRTRDLFLTKEVLYRLSYMGPSSIHYRRASHLAPKPACWLERETGFEPATPSLEGSRSTN
jgi:hypothetical protein